MLKEDGMKEQLLFGDTRSYRQDDLEIFHTVEIMGSRIGTYIMARWALWKGNRLIHESRGIHISNLWKLRDYLNEVERKPFPERYVKEKSDEEHE